MCLLEVFRQQELVVVIGAGDEEWRPQSDEEPAHDRHSAGSWLRRPPERRPWPMPTTIAGHSGVSRRIGAEGPSAFLAASVIRCSSLDPACPALRPCQTMQCWPAASA